jgi:dTDP-L-rhamnose 4-epimerase
MTVLIVGGGGFIGTKLSEQLDEKAVIFDNFSPIVHTKNTMQPILQSRHDVIVGDVRDSEDVRGLISRVNPETLVYLAAETGTGRSLYNTGLNAGVNVLGLAHVLDEISRSDARPARVVFTSTRAVYGEGPYQDKAGNLVYPKPRLKADLDRERFSTPDLTPVPMNAEMHAERPTNIYGSTKLCQENMLANWCASFEIPFYSFRLQNVFGGGQSLSNPYTGVLIQFFHRATQMKSIEVYENGGISRDFVHVDDVVRLLALGIHGNGAPGIYDCGSNERVTLDEVANKVARIVGAPDPVRVNKYRLGDIRHASADIARAQAQFDWEPVVSLEEGLNDLHKFYLKQ